jgi:hypothetical protein
MRYKWREIAGWSLVVLGLFMFYLAYRMLMGQVNPVTGEMRYMIIEAGQWSIVGIIVFRGGIHLLKVAVAARVCMQAVEEGRAEKPVAAYEQNSNPVSALESGFFQTKTRFPRQKPGC